MSECFVETRKVCEDKALCDWRPRLLGAWQRAQGGLSSLSGSGKGQLFPRRNKPGVKGDATAGSAGASPDRAQQLGRAGPEITGSPDHKAMSWL